MTPNSMAKKLRALADNIPAQNNLLKQALAQETVNQVVGDTPVDTGRARGGWITTIGRPDTTTVPQGAYGPSRHKGHNNIGFPTRGGDFSFNTADAKIKQSKPGEAIYLNNNLPYIGRLNDGYSAQAPSGFFEIAVTRARAILGRQKIRWKLE